MNKSGLIFLFLCFIGYRLYYLTGSYINHFIIYSLVQHFIIMYLLQEKALSISKDNLNKKSTWFYIAFIYYPAVIICYSIVKFNTVYGKADVDIVQNWGKSILEKSAAFRTDPRLFFYELIFIPLIILVVYLIIDRLTRTLHFKSDRLDSKHIFIFIKKPLYPINYLTAIFRRTPVISVFIYTDKLIYRFRKNNKKVKKTIYNDRINIEKYIIINTNVKIKDRIVQLSNLHNENWSYLNNCFPIFSKVTGINIFKLIKRRLIKNG